MNDLLIFVLTPLWGQSFYLFKRNEMLFPWQLMGTMALISLRGFMLFRGWTILKMTPSPFLSHHFHDKFPFSSHCRYGSWNGKNLWSSKPSAPKEPNHKGMSSEEFALSRSSVTESHILAKVPNIVVFTCRLSVICFQNVIDRKPYPDDESLVEVKFATTPIMSTYLVAFVIGEYDFVESQSSDGVTVRVYTPVGKAEQGKFALEVRMLLKNGHFYQLLCDGRCHLEYLKVETACSFVSHLVCLDTSSQG